MHKALGIGVRQGGSENVRDIIYECPLKEILKCNPSELGLIIRRGG